MKINKVELDFKTVLMRSTMFVLMIITGTIILSWLVNNRMIAQAQSKWYLLALAFISSLCSNMINRKKKDVILSTATSIVSFVMLLLLGMLLFDGVVNGAGLTCAIIVAGGVTAAFLRPRGNKKRKR